MLLESTLRIVARRPAAAVPFLVALVVAYRLLVARRGALKRWAVRSALLLGVPLFAVLFLAEFSANPLPDRAADLLIHAETEALRLALALLDALFATWLRVALLAMDAAATAVEGTASDALPALSGLSFPVAVFCLEFAAGALLIYVLYRSTRPDGSWWRPWFTGIGAVLFCSGWLATLLRADAWRASEATLTGGFVAGTVGLAVGVMTMILAVRPNFEGDSLGARLRRTDLREALWGTGIEEAEPEPEGQAEPRAKR